jgi:hypothetical protein
MNLARFFTHDIRMAKAVAALGGVKIHAAMTEAEAQMDPIAGKSADHIDETLEFIDQTAADRRGARLVQLHRAVRDVAGAAAGAGLPDLETAAEMFGRLIDLAQRRGVLPDDQIQVNLGVMRLLRWPDHLSGDERQALLDSLRAVLDKAEKHAAA